MEEFIKFSENCITCEWDLFKICKIDAFDLNEIIGLKNIFLEEIKEKNWDLENLDQVDRLELIELIKLVYENYEI